MSKIGHIRLVGDTSTTLPGLGTENTPNLSIKPCEIRWNDMHTEEPDDVACRQHFNDRSEINAKTSGLPKAERFSWADWIADQSIDADAVFAFAPNKLLFPEQNESMVQALVQQKTQYSDFFKHHGRKTGHLKSFIIRTENWFTGIGLILWQCQALLLRHDTESRVSLTELKSLFDRIANRTRTVSLVRAKQLNSDYRDMILEEGMLGRLAGGFGKNDWVSFMLGHQSTAPSDRESLDTLLNRHLQDVIRLVEKNQLAFSRIVISCGQQQLEKLKAQKDFLQLDRMQASHQFRWLHHVAPISAQVLCGKDAIHISYAVKGDKP